MRLCKKFFAYFGQYSFLVLIDLLTLLFFLNIVDFTLNRTIYLSVNNAKNVQCRVISIQNVRHRCHQQLFPSIKIVLWFMLCGEFKQLCDVVVFYPRVLIRSTGTIMLYFFIFFFPRCYSFFVRLNS